MRRHLLVLLALLAVVAAACGTEAAEERTDETPATPDDGPDAAAELAAASAATADAGSAAMWMEMRIEGIDGPDGQPQTMSMISEGVFAFDTQRGQMTMDMGEMLAGMPGMDTTDAVMEIITDGMVMWMRAPFFTQMLGVDTPWLRMDLEELGAEAGVDLGELHQLTQQSDPTQFIAFLEGATDDVRVTGEEEVRGVATTRYEATVDLRQVYEEADLVRDRDQFEALMGQLGDRPLPMSVWVDADGLLRRQQFTFPIPELPPGAGATMTIELFDYGTEVEIAPPPDDQVTDFAELMARFEQGG